MNTLEFLTALYGETPGGKIVINKSLPGGGYQTKRTSQASIAASGGLVMDREAKPGEGIYHRITTLAPDWDPNCGMKLKRCQEAGACKGTHRGSALESYQSPGVFFDADIRSAGHKDDNKPDTWEDFRAVLDKAGFPAETSLVSSGGGYYPGFIHPEPYLLADRPRYAAMVQGLHGLANAWSQHMGIGKLDSTFDLARVLRLPGTVNRKPEYGAAGRECVVVHMDGPRYTLEELEAILSAAQYPPGFFAPTTRAAAGRATRADADPLFDEGGLKPVTEAQAWDRIELQLEKCRNVRLGDGANGTFGGAAKSVGRYVTAGVLNEEAALQLVIDACRANPYQDPAWYGSAPGRWTIEDVVPTGLRNGMEEDAQFDLVATAAETMAAGTPAARPALEIKSEGAMAYWLQENIGRGHLSGMFLRGGALVYTPVERSDGYVPPKDGSDSGMQVQVMSKISLAAQVQFSYQCFQQKTLKGAVGADGKKEPDTKYAVDAMFSGGSAERVVAAPEYAPNLRELRGVTHTPIMRKDGTVLDKPGYDPASGLLYAPQSGLSIEPVPENPTLEQTAAALAFVRGMVDEYPWVTPDDEANWLGMMLTPLMREVVTSDRKMFAINAHQAGSGKTFLALIAQGTHGAVFRSSLPEDEAEMRKWVTGVLSTTTAPMVIADNVTGTLRSPFLAGVLTSPSLTDRILGRTENVSLKQDRLWVITGNNVQIGQDIGRRLITIAIDPNMENPETRTNFKIKNLVSYASTHRGETLHALLTLMRAWVVAGRPMEDKAQSDNFREWEAAVGGILEVAGLKARFNSGKTRTVAKDVDKDDFGAFLAKLYRVFGSEPFYMADLMAKTSNLDSSERVSEDSLFDVVRPIGPSDMPNSKLEEQLRRNMLSSKGLGRMMGYKTKQYHKGFALIAGERDRNGTPWMVRATPEAVASL